MEILTEKEENTINNAMHKELIMMENLKKKVEGMYYSLGEERIKNEKLTCKNVRGSFQYYVDGKYKSKKHNMDEIKELAQEEYRKKLLSLIEKKIDEIKNVEKTDSCISNLYYQLPKGIQVLFEPDVIPLEKIVDEFEQATYEGLDFAEDDWTEYFTNKGERVRSKSEKIIADELGRHSIPYKYEKPLPLLIDGKIKEFYPDFTIISRSTGKIKYLEHLGMMDNSQYFSNVLSKLDAYEKNGLLIGRDIFLFHESSYRPLNTRVISDYIVEFFL